MQTHSHQVIRGLIIIIKCSLHHPLSIVSGICCIHGSVSVLYLGGSIGVHRDHVFDSLLDFELDVELSLQGSDAFLVG